MDDSLARQVQDTSLRQFAGYHMKRAYNVLRSDLTKALEPLGLRITTYSSLILVVENPGIRQSELASALDVERPNMVVILDDLEHQGWIDRKRVETDRRAYSLYATPAGRKVCEKAIAADLRSEKRLLGRLEPKEKRLLIEALNKIEYSVGE
jgi:DNA-binding MarR family transcriptional regulator